MYRPEQLTPSKEKVVCPGCGNVFVGYKSEKRRFCSVKCANNTNRLTPEQMSKQKQATSNSLKNRWANDDKYRNKMLTTVNVGVELNPNWRGDNASYGAKHQWLRNNLGPASKCECCGTKNASRYEWANLSGEYRRTADDYAQLCKKCHLSLDRSRKIWSALIHTETQRAVEAEAERTLKWMNERERPAEELIAGQEDYVKTLKATINQSKKEES